MIHEPVTTLTDYLLALLYLGGGVRLIAAGRARGVGSEVLWGMAFVLLGVAAMLGGTVHGAPHVLGPDAAATLWMLTLDAIAGASVLFVLAAVRETMTARAYGTARVIAGACFGLFAVWAARSEAFGAASLVSVVAMVVTGVMLGCRGHWWIVAGLVVALLGAVVQRSGLTLHRHFNHNDLYHTIQMLSALLLYRGGHGLGAR